MIRRGQKFLMDTGEKVEVVSIAYYITPRGDQALLRLRLLEQHTFDTTREVNGRFMPCAMTWRFGRAYELMPAELLRNGQPLVESTTDARGAA